LFYKISKKKWNLGTYRTNHMNITDLKDELKQLIAQGNNELALEKLMSIAKSQRSDIANMIYSLSAGYTEYQSDLNFGILSEEKTKEFRNELNYRLLNIVDDLEEVSSSDNTKEESKEPVEKTTPTKNKIDENITTTLPKRNVLKWMVPLFGIVLFGFAFKFFQPSTNPEIWLGVWNHELDIDGSPDQITKGFTKFQQEETELIGDGILKYPNNSTMEVILSNIQTHGNTMKGNWSWPVKHLPKKNPQKGTFEFLLSEDKKSFTGTYNRIYEKEKTHKWVGTKK